MQQQFLNALLAFFEGFALIVSPCILPILPIMLSGSLVGGDKRPLGIICGFIGMFTIFTLLSRKLVQLTGVDLTILRQVSLVLIALFGVIMFSTYLSKKFNMLTQGLANVGTNLSVVSSGNTRGGFLSGLLLGSVVSLVWTPCAGPILAAALVQIIIQKTTFQSLVTVFFFAVGSAVPLFIIALAGRKLTNKLVFFKKHGLFFRRLFGLIIITSAVFIFYQDSFATASDVAPTSQRNASQIIKGISPYEAPALVSIDAWINTAPLNLSALKGKVVLIDFWTYSCINCIRTLPYLKSWDKKYRDKGLVIIGVHSPEFEFEKQLSNVQRAVKKYDIKYPVALDNTLKTWLNYNNHYWPAHYLIDQYGRVVYQHFGEGEYDTTETNIQMLLGAHLPMTVEQDERHNNIFSIQTPEIYFGYDRADHFISAGMVRDQVSDYNFPNYLPLNAWALNGKWIIRATSISPASDKAVLRIVFSAGKVFLVAGSTDGKPHQIKIFLNSVPIGADAGKDIVKGILTIKNHTLYEIINFEKPNRALLELVPMSKSVELYTFTFGN